MDPYDGLIMKALRDGRPRGFYQLLEEVGFSHNAMRVHIHNLIERGLITRE